jgi:1,2-diacylglycerol 3-beta-glucosyltransferase
VLRLLAIPLLTLQGVLALSSCYLLALLAGAVRAKCMRAWTADSKVRDTDAGAIRFAILIPAHDEEHGIEATLAAIAACEYPADRRHAIVIADNCSDHTATLARLAGAEVWERTHTTKLGKGHALTWGMEQLCGSLRASDFDAVIALDADCLVSPNLLGAIDGAMRSGADAVQVDYLVGNPTESTASALRFAGFALMCTVRPLGKQGLGLSCGLFGTGMAFTMELLHSEPWTTTDFGEDFEHHLRLVQAGKRVEFLSRASVTSAMPISFSSSAVQQERWEKGKLVLMRHRSLPAVLAGLKRGDLVLLHAGLEQFVPPQSLISAGSAGSALAAVLLRSRRLLGCSLATLAAQALFVLGGLRLVRAPIEVYRALLTAPALVAGKLAIYARLLRRKEPLDWVRTAREQSAEWDLAAPGHDLAASNGSGPIAGTVR